MFKDDYKPFGADEETIKRWLFPASWEWRMKALQEKMVNYYTNPQNLLNDGIQQTLKFSEELIQFSMDTYKKLVEVFPYKVTFEKKERDEV